MTHMHIPDGVLPVWLWLLGFFLMFLAMAVSMRRLRGRDLKREIPLLGAISAAMLVAMSLEILPILYHINLSVVAGILLGPALGFLAAFITNLVLALMGHGGITVIGLNTLLLGMEAILGHTLFHVVRGRLPVFWRAAVATVLTLFITTMALIGIVASSHLSPELFTHEHHKGEMVAEHHEQHSAEQNGELSIGRFATMVLSLGAVGWIIEAAVTGAVVSFIAKVKPDLIGHTLHRDRSGKEGETTK
jgi:cobalt/nickel transport system permease protein